MVSCFEIIGKASCFSTCRRESKQVAFHLYFCFFEKNYTTNPNFASFEKGSSKKEAREYKSENSKYLPIKLTFPEFSGLPSEQGF